MGAYMNALREEGSKEEILEQLEAKMDEIERLRGLLLSALGELRHAANGATGPDNIAEYQQLTDILEAEFLGVTASDKRTEQEPR